MAESKTKVQARLRELLDERPDSSTDELQAAALEIDPSLAPLSRRQFNAGYVLPLKRGRTPSGAPKAPRATRRRAKSTRRKKGATAAASTRRTRRDPQQMAEASNPDRNARDQVREILLRFARDLTRAESRTEIIDLLGSLDSYADDVLAAAK